MTAITTVHPSAQPELPGDAGLEGRTCLVTGASSGIGRATAIALAAAGADVRGVARRGEELRETARLAAGGGRFEWLEVDLSDPAAVRRLAAPFAAGGEAVDVLVHSAGTIALGNHATATLDDLDRQYALNVRAPYALTQALLPPLRARRGQIVFVNSTVGLRARANVGQFAATQHALKAIADSLRAEVNDDGMRVVSIYPGRTATPRQARIHAIEHKAYRPEQLMQPGDVASVVLQALALPRTAELTDIAMRPMHKH